MNPAAEASPAETSAQTEEEFVIGGYRPEGSTLKPMICAMTNHQQKLSGNTEQTPGRFYSVTFSRWFRLPALRNFELSIPFARFPESSSPKRGQRVRKLRLTPFSLQRPANI